jgi:hypothetical protein
MNFQLFADDISTFSINPKLVVKKYISKVYAEANLLPMSAGQTPPSITEIFSINRVTDILVLLLLTLGFILLIYL